LSRFALWPDWTSLTFRNQARPLGTRASRLSQMDKIHDIDYFIGDAVTQLMDKVERIEAADPERYKAKLASAQKMIDMYHESEMQNKHQFLNRLRNANLEFRDVIKKMAAPSA
ncbi:hypothetical protein PMAYCL1PPCAC_30528, partial [Pristionchus mayeri]